MISRPNSAVTTAVLIDTYRMDDAERVFVAMGSLVGTLKEVVDDLRAKGEKVGILKIRSYRPFPKEKILEVCGHVKEMLVLEKALSFGSGGMLQEELRAAFYGQKNQPTISGFVLGSWRTRYSAEHSEEDLRGCHAARSSRLSSSTFVAEVAPKNSPLATKSR